MGLDISVYSSWTPYDGEVKDWDHAEEIMMTGIDLTHVYNMEGFASRAKGMPEWVVAKFVDSFRAGSYGGYNRFRDTLCRALHGFGAKALWAMVDEELETHAMWQILHFSDCEGVLGTEVCRTLHAELEEHWDKVTAYFAQLDDGDYYQGLLGTWRDAFKAASAEGFIGFH